MTGKIVSFLSTNLEMKATIIFILTITAIEVIDSAIIKFSSYSNAYLPMSSNVILFAIFYFVLSMTSIILLNSVKKYVLKSHQKGSLSTNYFLGISYAIQILMLGIILTIIVQMIFVNKYSLVFLRASTIIAHFSALFFLSFLIFMFVSWVKSKRNYITILYLVSFSLISVTIIVSLAFLEYQFSHSHSIALDRKPYPIYSYVTRQEATADSELLRTIFDIVYLSSFIAIWIATVTLLSQYRYKLGRIKFFAMISIPLIYYLFTFEGYFGNVFSPLIIDHPITFGVVYTLLFSATKQVGALLFSISFLTASILVTNDRVRKSLLISSIGIAILFGSIEIMTLQYRLYPPFGLVTVAFMPLGVYLLFIGIFTSATSVSRDADLRKQFYKTAQSQLSLLKTIGITQMENELLKKYKPVLSRSNQLEEAQFQPLEQSDVKEIIRDVLQELQSRQIYKSKVD